jgi:hypothetical protein
MCVQLTFNLFPFIVVLGGGTFVAFTKVLRKLPAPELMGN